LLDEIIYLPYENTSEIINFINQTYSRLDLDVKKINSDSFEQLNLQLLMEIFSNYLNSFNLYRQLMSKSESEDDSKAQIIINKRKNKDNDFSNANLNNENDASLKNVSKNKFGSSSIQRINKINNLKEEETVRK